MPYARTVRRAACLLSAGVLSMPLMASSIASALRTRASRRCAYENTPANRGRLPYLRWAVVCLVDRARARFGLTPLHVRVTLDRAAQGHANEMVAQDNFAHDGPGGTPGTRLDHAGYRWSSLGEAIATGYRTPGQTVRAWLHSADHCRILLSPAYADMGVGLNPRPVRGAASGPATWTVDLALHAGRRSPSHNWAPARTCPH